MNDTLVLLASELSERDTLRGNIVGCLFVFVWTYACHFVSTSSYFGVSSTFDPSQTSLNIILGLAIITHIIQNIELFTALNSFAGAVKTQKLTGVPFLFS